MANFPTSLHTVYTLVDNTDDVLATHPNALSAELLEAQEKIGINSSADSDSIDYFINHASGDFRTHDHSGGAGDGVNIPIANVTGLDIDDCSDVDTSGKADGDLLKYVSSSGKWESYAIPLDTSAIEFIIDGGGAAITTGIKGDLLIPFDCDITVSYALADVSGSIVVDVWNDTYANFPPTDADTITSATPVTISGATKSTDSTLTSWTTSITSNDILRFNVDSCSTITRCTVVLKVTRS